MVHLRFFSVCKIRDEIVIKFLSFSELRTLFIFSTEKLLYVDGITHVLDELRFKVRI